MYLDNAIEAADKSKDKVIGVEVFQDNDKIIFVISDPYVLHLLFLLFRLYIQLFTY